MGSPASAVLRDAPTSPRAWRTSRLPSTSVTSSSASFAPDGSALDCRRPGPTGSAGPSPCFEDPRRPLRFLGDPCACVPCSKTPAGSTHLAHGGVPLLPSEKPTSSAPATCLLSEFDRTAHMLAVYASRTGSPQHPARLATRPVAGLCRGGIGYPLDPVTRFRGFRSSHPPCPDFPDAPASSTGAASVAAPDASRRASARECRTRSVRSSQLGSRCS